MIRKLFLISIVAAVFFIPCFISGLETPVEPGIMSIGCEEDRFVDGAGRHVIMRGANAGSRGKLPPFYPFEPEPDFETALEKFTGGFESLGFNVVRLLVIYEAAEPVRGQYDEEYLKIYDKLVNSFGRRGVHVIVDSHQDIFSRRFCGDGFPDWALAQRYRDNRQRADCGLWELKNLTLGVAGSWNRFWNNKDGIQDSYVEFFRMLAERYKNNPAVIGFEPINEPMPGTKGLIGYSKWNEEKLYVLYEKVGKAVNSVAPRFIIFSDVCALENLGSWNESRRRPEIPNLAFAPHYYDVGYFKFNLTTGRDEEIMRNGLKKHIRLGRHWRVPVLIGEYGIEMQREDAPAYIDKLYSVFDELLLSGTIWEASMSPKLWNGRDKCIFDPDGAPRRGTLALDRPYPRAVAGIIESFTFERDTNTFTMKYAEHSRINMPTEIYIPARIYGDNPVINIQPDGPYEFEPARRLLKITNLGKDCERKITVSAR